MYRMPRGNTKAPEGLRRLDQKVTSYATGRVE